MTPTEDIVEIVARAMCIAEGRDPDRVSPFIKVPLGEAPDMRHDRLWKNYETVATAAITAYRTAQSTNVDGLVERLHDEASYLQARGIDGRCVMEAAERLEALEAENATLRSELGEMRETLEEAYAAFRWVYENGVVPAPLRPQWVSDVFNNAYASERIARTALSRVSNDTTVSEMGDD